MAAIMHARAVVAAKAQRVGGVKTAKSNVARVGGLRSNKPVTVCRMGE